MLGWSVKWKGSVLNGQCQVISERIRGEMLMRSTLYVFVLQTSNLFCTALPSLYSFSFCLTVLLYIFIVVIKGIAANFFYCSSASNIKKICNSIKDLLPFVYAVLMQTCLSPWLQMTNNPCVVWSCSHTPSMCALRLADTHLLGYLALNAQCW